jgi:hypothetical protein
MNSIKADRFNFLIYSIILVAITVVIHKNLTFEKRGRFPLSVFFR